MGEMCIELSQVKNGMVRRAVGRYADKNKDGKVCTSEVPRKEREAFEEFVMAEKGLLHVEYDGKKIARKQFDVLAKLAADNEPAGSIWSVNILQLSMPQEGSGVTLDQVIAGAKVEDGNVVGLDLRGLSIRDIRALKGLTFLRKLELSGGAHLSAGIEGLKQALPSLEITLTWSHPYKINVPKMDIPVPGWLPEFDVFKPPKVWSWNYGIPHLDFPDLMFPRPDQFQIYPPTCKCYPPSGPEYFPPFPLPFDDYFPPGSIF